MTDYKRDVYTWIASGLLISAPLAAAIPFGYGVFTEVNEYTGLFGLAVLSAFAIAATLEGVGMLGGHLAITLQRRNDGRWLLAGSTVLIYTAVGIGVLGLLLRQWVGAVAFGLVPVVYILVGLLLDARAVQTEQRETAQQAWEREQQAIADERQYKLERLKIRQGVTHDNDMTPVTVRHDTDHDRHSDNGMSFPGNWTELTPEHKAALKGMTPVEIERMAPVSYRTAIRWRDRVSANGSGK